MYEVTLFGLKFTLNPVAFTLPIGGGWTIYWYGIIIATGFLLAVLYAMKNADRFGLNRDRMLDVVLVTTPLAILCARAYYCIFDNQEGLRIHSVKEFFGIGTGQGFQGLAIYGGVIGAFAVGYFMCRIRKVKVLDMFDLTAIGFLIGQGIGRWGNFFNQEAYGAFTGSDWFGMASKVTGNRMVHPCFLYESIWCIAGFFILNHFGKKRRFSGEITLMYGVWYGFGRFFIELLRQDSLMIGRLRVSALLSAVVFAASMVALILLRRRAIVSASSASYNGLFTEQMVDEIPAAIDETPENAEKEENAFDGEEQMTDE